MKAEGSPWIYMQGKTNGLHALEGNLGVHVLAWRDTDNPNDPWDRRIINFKDGHSMAIQGACEIMVMVFSDLLQRLNTQHHKVGLVTALSHDDTHTDKTKPLSKLANSLTREFNNLCWLPNILQKDRHEKLLAQTGEERDREIQGKYRCGELPDNIQSIIIIDDLTTRGATFSEIARAIKERNSRAEIHLVALGKNYSSNYMSKVMSNKHIEGRFSEIENIWSSSS